MFVQVHTLLIVFLVKNCSAGPLRKVTRNLSKAAKICPPLGVANLTSFRLQGTLQFARLVRWVCFYCIYCRKHFQVIVTSETAASQICGKVCIMSVDGRQIKWLESKNKESKL